MSGAIEKEILNILEDAIQRERAAYKLYSRGKELAGEGELKKVFSMLAAEEENHEKLIRQVYYNYKKRLGLKVLHPDDES